MWNILNKNDPETLLPVVSEKHGTVLRIVFNAHIKPAVKHVAVTLTGMKSSADINILNSADEFERVFSLWLRRITSKLQVFAKQIHDELDRKTPDWKQHITEDTASPKPTTTPAAFQFAYIENSWRLGIMPLSQKLISAKGLPVALHEVSLCLQAC